MDPPRRGRNPKPAVIEADATQLRAVMRAMVPTQIAVGVLLTIAAIARYDAIALAAAIVSIVLALARVRIGIAAVEAEARETAWQQWHHQQERRTNDRRKT